MARLTNFIYCLNVERIQAIDGKGESINAIGILSAITPEFVPGTYSFSVVFSVLDIDFSGNNTIQIIFSKEGVQEPLVDSGVIALSPMADENEIGLPKEHRGLNMSMDFRNIVFESEGLYHTTVYFDGVLLEKASVYVKGKRTAI